LYYIGIDVGLTGSICILDDKGKLLESIKMPVVDVEDSVYKHWYDPGKILEIFQRNYPAKVILEYQRPMTGQGISTTFRLGRGFGLLEGLSHSVYHRDVYIIDPKKWQNTLSKKYLTKEQIKSFVKKNLNYDYILSTIKPGDFKDRYIKMLKNKSISPSKAKSFLIFYSITQNEGEIDILYKDHNRIDAYLMAKFCFENNFSK
jgi:hypothetical protein